MAYGEVSRMEIQEIIRRWQAGASPRQIVSGVGLARNTVRKYLAAAQAEGIVQDGPGHTDSISPKQHGGGNRHGMTR